jgi:hypothetical protein
LRLPRKPGRIASPDDRYSLPARLFAEIIRS